MKPIAARAPSTLGPEFGGPAEAYQVAVRNQAYSRSFAKAHETHYEPWVQNLVADAPLHLDAHERVALPPADPDLLGMTVRDAVLDRRSGRSYGPDALRPGQLATLLRCAAGMGEPTGHGRGSLRRSVANSGNLGSVEIYPIVLRGGDIPPGIYHFDSVHHDLALLHSGRFATWLRERVLFQLEFSDAAVALVLTSAFGRLKAKYGPRGYRLGLLDVGHVSQNIYLLATALGLEVCATAGFIDNEVETALNIDGIETAASLFLLLGTPPG